MKLSVIIPMYNTESYISKCVLSCLNQDIPRTEFEIIVVNDGSSDNSLKIVESIALKFPNIQIISQKNAGLSEARNVGLMSAKGQYVWFIDSDDWIQKNCFKKILRICEFENLEGLAISASDVYQDHSALQLCYHKRIYYNTKKVISGREALNYNMISYCAPLTIYNRSFLIKNNLRFYPHIFHEDIEFTNRSYYYIKRVGFLDDALYNVYQNPNSITRTLNPQKSYDLIIVAVSLDKFCIQNVKRKDRNIYHNVISICLNNALLNICNHDKEIQHIFNYKLYENKNLINHYLKSNNIKYKIEGILFLLMPLKYTKIYKIIHKLKMYNN